MTLDKYKYIIWDWNGTLLDDVEASLLTINEMLKKRTLGSISLSEYKSLFCFPVSDFYKKIGFKDDLNLLATEYWETYENFRYCEKLSLYAIEVLDFFHQKNVIQFILSAKQENLLHKEVESYNILLKFKDVYGCLTSGEKKEWIGDKMIKYYDVNSHETLMIGDTHHDIDIAKKNGFDYLFYSGGHNTISDSLPLRNNINSLIDIFKLFNI